MGKTKRLPLASFNRQKHPHRRGEDVVIASTGHCVSETPPQAWGRPPDCNTSACWQGNTPTGVGKTTSPRSTKSTYQKHPHRRGEDQGLLLWRPLKSETPPQAWGRRTRNFKITNNTRNTPTGVGKTLFDINGLLLQGKHPHRRGEDYLIILQIACYTETPPQAWGRRAFRRRTTMDHRNTPTGVGKTSEERSGPGAI